MTMADSTPAASPWVVLKFGGTSVSSVANWKNIAAVVRDRLAEGMRPVIVHSALSGITDRLEQLLAISLDSQNTLGNEAQAVMNQIEQRHRDLARDLGSRPARIWKNSSNGCDRSRPASRWSAK
jgi:diaminopimelate decarboxylase/aspartate kinase